MTESYDVVVIGSGPAGQKAAIHAAHAGRRALVIEQEVSVGGSCVHRGTIPSKTLRETALALSSFHRRTGSVFEVRVSEELQVASLMSRMEEVVKAHERVMRDQLLREGVEVRHGRARFLSPHEVEVRTVRRDVEVVRGEHVVIATGSRPRTPPNVPVDHQHVLDSDSILSMIYLPASLMVLGAGVIASEYASIFAALGVRVFMVDRGERPLSFLDPELSDEFVRTFQEAGGRYLGGRRVKGVAWDGVSAVVTTLESGLEIKTEKALCCLGRVANLEGLQIEAAGLAPTDRGLLPVDEHLRTAQPNVYGVGDVIGPPSLAATSMDQGRRAIAHALGMAHTTPPEHIPLGIYTIPEIASVGLSEQQAIERHGGAMIGRARFDELARGRIAGIQDGLLKLVADADGRRLLGVQIVGEGAAELIHVGQMALLAGAPVDVFVDTTFNFPTLAEAYRAAALDLIWQRNAVVAV